MGKWETRSVFQGGAAAVFSTAFRAGVFAFAIGTRTLEVLRRRWQHGLEARLLHAQSSRQAVLHTGYSGCWRSQSSASLISVELSTRRNQASGTSGHNWSECANSSLDNDNGRGKAESRRLLVGSGRTESDANEC